MKTISHPFRAVLCLEWVIFVSVLLLGCALRVVALGAHPYGLYQDEAINALDASRVLAGAHPLYFSANNGREPLFIYAMALTVAAWGRTTLGVRAAAALLGCLTLPATYILGQTWARRRVGILATGILATMLWHVHLSRVGFRAVALPLLIALALALGAYALRRRSIWASVGAGALYGLSFYTYLPARFTPLALGLMGLYGWFWHRDWLRARWRELLTAAVVATLTLAPLGWLMVTDPALVLGRGSQVAIWNPAINGGNLAGALWQSIWRALGMFTWRGDAIWRHNVPARPVFDPLIGLAFLGGIVLALRRWRSEPAGALSLIWIVTLLLPTALAEDAPHFLRGVGVLPMVTLLPALALDRIAELLARRALAGVVAAGLAVVLGAAGVLTARDYFGCRSQPWLRVSGFDYVGCYASDPVRGYFFQAAATDLAYEINRAQGTVVVAQRLWEAFPSIQFLAGERESLQLYTEGETLESMPPPMTLIVWPHEPLEPTLNVLPRHSTIQVVPGPETRGDLEPEPYVLYVRYQVTAAEALPTPLARYANGITLLRVESEPNDNGWHFRVWWQAEEIPTQSVQVFVHLTDSTGTIVTQHDGPPGTPYYPPLSWRLEDVIIEEFTLAGTTRDDMRIRIGLYNPTNGIRLSPMWTDAPITENALELTLVGS